MKKEIMVSGTFMEMLTVRYSAQLGRAEIRRAMRDRDRKLGYSKKIRKLNKELKDIYNKLLVAEPEEIPRLRKRFIKVRKDIQEIRENRANDPVLNELKDKSAALRESIAKLDEAIVRELRNYGYEVRPETDPERVGAKVKELIPEPRQAPDEVKSEVKITDGAAAPAEPAEGE